MSAQTDEDLTILESLDFDPACEKTNHDSGESARWVVIYTPTGPCGCPTAGVLVWCEPCRVRHLRSRWTVCGICGDKQPTAPWPGIARFEPLR